MTLKGPLVFGLFLGSLSLCLVGVAAEEHGRSSPRPRPPAFQPHPAGVHPRGATVHSRPVRVLAPKVVDRGRHEWTHWEHTQVVRPAYYWDWQHIHSVMCVAEDSYGDQVSGHRGGTAGLRSRGHDSSRGRRARPVLRRVRTRPDLRSGDLYSHLSSELLGARQPEGTGNDHQRGDEAGQNANRSDGSQIA